MGRQKSPKTIRLETIAQYKRQYSVFTTSSLINLCKKVGFTDEDIESKNHSQLAYLMAHSKYVTAKGYDIYGNNTSSTSKDMEVQE